MATNIALSKAYTKSIEPFASYPDTGNVELTDGNRGVSSANFWEDASWQGHPNLPATLQVKIDFGSVQSSLDEFRSYHGHRTDVGILRPQTVEVFTSDNDVDYTSRGAVDESVATNDEGYRWVYTITLGSAISARYVRFDITRQAQLSYVFSAEVEVYQGEAPPPPGGGFHHQVMQV